MLASNLYFARQTKPAQKTYHIFPDSWNPEAFCWKHDIRIVSIIQAFTANLLLLFREEKFNISGMLFAYNLYTVILVR